MNLITTEAISDLANFEVRQVRQVRYVCHVAVEVISAICPSKRPHLNDLW